MSFIRPNLSFNHYSLTQEEIYALDNIRSKTYHFYSIRQNFREDKEFILKLLYLNYEVYDVLPYEIKHDRDVVLATLDNAGHYLTHVPSYFKDDKEAILLALSQDLTHCHIKDVGKKLRNDKEVALAAVKQSGLFLEHLSNEMKNDKDVVKAAIKQYSKSYIYASENMKDDNEIILMVLKKTYFYYNDIPEYKRNIIGRDNPIKVLEELIEKEQLQKKLEHDLPTSFKNEHKVKI